MIGARIECVIMMDSVRCEDAPALQQRQRDAAEEEAGGAAAASSRAAAGDGAPEPTLDGFAAARPQVALVAKPHRHALQSQQGGCRLPYL